MLATLELFAAGACMGGSMTGFAVNREREPNTAYFYNLIMMVIGTIAASLVFVHQPRTGEPIYLVAMFVIAASLAIAASRSLATGGQVMGSYFSALSAAVAIALVQIFTKSGALSSSSAMLA